jgi:predicted N-acyltransferase
MEMEITDTIQHINETEWEALVESEYIEKSYKWFKTMEESGMRDMRYIFVKDETLKAAACCYIYSEKMGVTMLFLDVKAFISKDPECTHLLLKGLYKIQKKEKTKGILFFFLKKSEFDSIKPSLKGFTAFSMQEDTYLDLDFADFDEYLASLEEKAWRSARMTLKRARKEFKIQTVYTNEFSQWKTTAHQLQGYLCKRFNDYRAHFSLEFYDALERNLKDNAELILFFKDDIPIAFALPFFTSTICEHKLLGLDPHYRKYQAYFLFYYEGIRRGIERGHKRMYFGSTTYEFKERIGCKREPLFGLVKLENPFLHLALTAYIAVLTRLGRTI